MPCGTGCHTKLGPAAESNVFVVTAVTRPNRVVGAGEDAGFVSVTDDVV